MLIDHVLASVTIYSMMEKHKELMAKYKELTANDMGSMEKVVVFLASPKQEMDIHFLHSLLNRWYVRLHKYCLATFVEEYRMILVL